MFVFDNTFGHIISEEGAIITTKRDRCCKRNRLTNLRSEYKVIIVL
jgi:hypothetical protein